MDWRLLKSNDSTQLSHLNRILAEIQTTINALAPGGGFILDGGDSTSDYSGGAGFDMGGSA